MQETRQQRINRLKGQRADLQGKIKAFRAEGVRSVEHKIAGLNAQVEAIDRAVKKLKGVK